jgi:mxaJ protein
MCSHFRRISLLAVVLLVTTRLPADEMQVLRVAADPNNLPFSNDRCEGFENKIAALVAKELGLRLEYVWHAQRRGFFRETLKDGNADIVLGVPARFDRALTTIAYYRSTYAFVTRHDRAAGIRTLDDPRLQHLRIGVQLVGDDGANTPPVHVLVARGLVTNLVGFTLYGDYRQPNPPAQIIDAVSQGRVDVAVAWGPVAGYFAKQRTPALAVVPIEHNATPSALPMQFDISIGVKKGNTVLRDKLNSILQQHRAEIDRLLDDYGVPRIARPAPAQSH